MSVARKRPGESRAQDRKVKDAYLFILSGKYNAAALAGKLDVSVPTASRLLEGLKRDLVRRGRRLVSVRSEEGFHYEIRDEHREARLGRDPLLSTTIPARRGRRGLLKPEDRELYEGD
jgi:hypothetical protein